VTAGFTYDSLNNLTSESSPLGRTAFSYLRATGRLQSALLPNGQSTTLTYFDNAGDQRLRQIKNLGSDGEVVSQFDHTYAASGEVQTLTRQISAFLGGTPTGYQFAYDAGRQLSAATLRRSDGSVIGAFKYAYDAAGNRTLQQANDNVSTPTYNNVNELADLSYVYDGNGNLISDGTRAFEWDAEDRLTAVVLGLHRSEFGYDGFSRRIRIVERDSNAVVSDKHLIWCGASICEERDVVNGLTKRFFTSGEAWSQRGVDTPYYYSRDRLGSIREMTDCNGAVVASYDYDAWGRASNVSGSIEPAFGYAGYYVHSPSGLYLTQYRAYDPNLGRWLSRDPLGEQAGPNAYVYVGNEPVGFIDPFGLKSQALDLFSKKFQERFRVTNQYAWNPFSSLFGGKPIPLVGITTLTGGATAEYIGALTGPQAVMQALANNGWLVAGAGESAFAGAPLSTLAAAAGATALGNAVLVGGAFEAGIAAGSAIGAFFDVVLDAQQVEGCPAPQVRTRVEGRILPPAFGSGSMVQGPGGPFQSVVGNY
jgi:RHS repeat-associated protein